MTGLEAVWTGQFEPTADSVAAVRQIVAGHLEGVAAPCLEAVVLIASELASNVVRHASTPYEVRLRINESVVIEVMDRGGGVPEVQHPVSDATGGRGLLIVSTLASEWGCDRRDGTKTVWAQVRCGPAP